MTDPDLTPLDLAHAAMTAAPQDDAARLRFYERLADGEMILLLASEAEGETLTPRVFDLEDGPVVLLFDREDRLAAFTGAPAPYAALPGRVILSRLAGQGVGLGVNLGVAQSETLLPASAVDWLAETLAAAPPAQVTERPQEFLPPKGLPPGLVDGLGAKLARAAGLADHALLAAVRYAGGPGGGGRPGHMLAFVAARPGAEPALARAVAETLAFSGLEAGQIDVAFLAPGPAAQAMAQVALRFDLTPAPQADPDPAPRGPGMDPDRPPFLR